MTEILDEDGDDAGALLDAPWGLALDEAGNVYVSGWLSHNVFRIDRNGDVEEILNSTGAGIGAPCENPTSLAIDGSGNIYVAGTGSDNVLSITPAGLITEIMNSAGDGAGSSLSAPQDLAFDPSGDLYVTGYLSKNVFRVRTPAGSAQISEFIRSQKTPESIAIDDAGYVFICFDIDVVRYAPLRVESYCSSLPNATGQPAILSYSGDSSDCLTLHTTPVPSTTAQYFMGTSEVAGTPFGDGLACTGGSITPLRPHATISEAMGSFTASLALNYTAPYAAGFTGTKHFQLWFRSGLDTGAGFNTSNAIRVTF